MEGCGKLLWILPRYSRVRDRGRPSKHPAAISESSSPIKHRPPSASACLEAGRSLALPSRGLEYPLDNTLCLTCIDSFTNLIPDAQHHRTPVFTRASSCASVACVHCATHHYIIISLASSMHFYINRLCNVTRERRAGRSLHGNFQRAPAYCKSRCTGRLHLPGRICNAMAGENGAPTTEYR